MAVFLDNRTMYDRALRYFTGQAHRPDDIPYVSGRSPSGDQIGDNEYFTTFKHLGSQGTIPDYGYNGVLKHYIWENGQNQESSRDQQHAFFRATGLYLDGMGRTANGSDAAQWSGSSSNNQQWQIVTP
ncbi:RICIN domain-containing protein [Paenibacillus alkalitolerans]|uniref:RICIN domain-containing protein n=1 Tax=Paenibacillus alkalitolerans TaxID=2799335 RepID=UPI001F308F94|nr:RICIN domain-containing protein [Paenibacillus alkalitolerans]